jgi:hypothetical protein
MAARFACHAPGPTAPAAFGPSLAATFELPSKARCERRRVYRAAAPRALRTVSAVPTEAK